MAWDRLEPQDTTKIRDLGTVIRPNFQAIDSGDSTFKPIALNLSDRDTDPLSGSSDPAAIADAYLLYCKQDTGGDPELFGIDASSNVIQFTDGAPTLAQNGQTFLPGGLLLQWGRGFIVGATSSVAVVFPSAFSAAAYSVVNTPYDSPVTGSSPREVGITNASITAAGFTAASFNGAVPAGGVNFGWIAIGPA
jgi:hypothetical protein